MVRHPPRSTQSGSSAASDVYKRQALACGASKWQMIKRIILPSALPGVMTGLILAMARGAGEVAPLMVTGVVKLAPSLPIDGEGPFIHLERKFMHLGFHIYDVGFQSPDSDAAQPLSLIHISEPTRLGMISYAVFCLKKKTQSPQDRQKYRIPSSA